MTPLSCCGFSFVLMRQEEEEWRVLFTSGAGTGKWHHISVASLKSKMNASAAVSGFVSQHQLVAAQ